MNKKTTRRGFTQTAVNNTVILNLIQDLRRLPLQLLNNMRGRFQIKFGMTTLFNHGAFTLIELLVVVLIIGILAAVAVPQYKVAVEKSQFIKLVRHLDVLAQNFEIYYLREGEYPPADQWGSVWKSFDTSLPGCAAMNSQLLMCPDMDVDMYVGSTKNLAARSKNGKIGYIRYLNYSNHPGRKECFALPQDKLSNQVCLSLGGKDMYSYAVFAKGWNTYALP